MARNADIRTCRGGLSVDRCVGRWVRRCLFAIRGGRGLVTAAPRRTNLQSHDDVFALAVAPVVAIVFAVLAGTAAWLAYSCGSDLVRRRPTAWRLSVCWLCLAAVIATSERLDLLVLVVICVQLGTLLAPGARLHMLQSDQLVS
jgi:hypothetical protein